MNYFISYSAKKPIRDCDDSLVGYENIIGNTVISLGELKTLSDIRYAEQAISLASNSLRRVSIISFREV